MTRPEALNPLRSSDGREPERGTAGVDGDETLVLAFDDNRLLAELCGEHDQHLALLEQRLEVAANPRGNRIALRGTPEACELARQVLISLYERLRHGLRVEVGEVEGEIRLRQAGVIHGQGADDVHIRTKRKTILPRTPMQKAYIESLRMNELVFGTGPAGTGKTYLAVACAAAALAAREVDRIILSRPAVEAGERLGFLPGDMKEKVDPYLRPLYDALYDVMPANAVARGMIDGTIEIAPLAFMRGRTLSSAFIILDEAQNTTPQQMKMFLTRLGERSRMAVTGDTTQVDLPVGVSSGLSDAIRILAGVESIDHIAFTDADIVRHPLIAKIVSAYERSSGGDVPKR